MKHSINNDYFINEDFFDDNTNTDTEDIIDDEFDDLNTETASPEEKKAASNMKLVLAFSYVKSKKVKNYIRSFISTLFNTYDNLFSVFYIEVEKNQLPGKQNSETFYSIYYKLKPSLNVNLFYSFAKALVSFLRNLYSKTVSYIYCKFFKYYPEEDLKSWTAYTINSLSYPSDENNIDYLTASVFMFNDLFDKYVDKFSLEKVIDALKTSNAMKLSLEEANDYLENNALYIFVPLIYISGISYDIQVSLSKLKEAVIVDELNLKTDLSYIYYKNDAAGLTRNHNMFKYSLDDYKKSLDSVSKLITMTDDDSRYKDTYKTYWHKKPFYVYETLGEDTLKIPAIAVKIVKDKDTSKR